MNTPCNATETHTVFNQPPSLEPYNLFATDTALREALQQAPVQWSETQLNNYGHLSGHALFSAGYCRPLTATDHGTPLCSRQ